MKAAKTGSVLLGKGFTDVSYNPGPQRTASMYVVRDYEDFDSRESIVQEIMESLKDVNVNRIGCMEWVVWVKQHLSIKILGKLWKITRYSMRWLLPRQNCF